MEFDHIFWSCLVGWNWNWNSIVQSKVSKNQDWTKTGEKNQKTKTETKKTEIGSISVMVSISTGKTRTGSKTEIGSILVCVSISARKNPNRKQFDFGLISILTEKTEPNILGFPKDRTALNYIIFIICIIWLFNYIYTYITWLFDK